MKLSKISSDMLNGLTINLDLKRNIVCRIALCKSLNKKQKVENHIISDSEGYEFNRSTIMSNDDLMFRSLVAFVQQERVGPDFFNVIVKNHIEQGLSIMEEEYQRINSPVNYLIQLIDTNNTTQQLPYTSRKV